MTKLSRLLESSELAPALDAARQTAGRSAPVYVVGGALRDAALGRPFSDLDFACAAEARAYAARLAENLGGTFVALDDVTRIYRVVLTKRPAGPVTQIDVAEIQGGSISQDLSRRDFTINAMAWPLEGGDILDPRGGMEDLKRRALRADRDSVFQEDPLRLLRAFRQAAQLGLHVEPSTLKSIRKHRKLIQRSSGERVRQELLALLSCSPASPWLRLMDEAGLLTALFEEMEATRRCAEEYYGKGGVLRHSLDVAARMDFLLDGMGRIFPKLAADAERYLAAWGGGQAAPRSLLRLAALLHDVAKPPTARRIAGRLRFFGHEARGATMASMLLKRLRFSNAEIEAVTTCIRHHLRPGNLAVNAVISNKAAFRFFRDLGPHGPALLLVCWADHASYLTEARLKSVLRYVGEDPHSFRTSRVRDADTRKTLRHLQVVSFLLDGYFRRREQILPPRLLDGNQVMRALGIPPSPAVGKVLRKLQEAQAAGKVKDSESALRFIKRFKKR